jgi:hypothetical protein
MSVRSDQALPFSLTAERADRPESQKVRCLCGKWWSYRSGGQLILRCKLCRREILISGEKLTITYR